MNQRVGTAAEQQAAAHLQQQGLTLVDTQARCRAGELDLVMREGDTWVFVEVKARHSEAFGGGLAAITAAKQQKLRRAASWYLQRRNATEQPCRFDVVAVNLRTDDLTWIRNAF